MSDGGRLLSFSAALREGLDQAMARDPRVLVIGEGVPDPKAIFNTTKGLREKYGNRRVFDMPLAENGMTGICIGAALNGMRPVLIHQRIDFSLLAIDQLVNNAAKWHYMFDGQASVPLVVRMLIGRGWGQGPQHAQSLQAMFAQVPGLKVVMPVSAYDAKGMMTASIEDDNPVIFIEHRWLHLIEDRVPESYYTAPLERARVLREGTDVTIAAFSYMAVDALIASRVLADVGIGVEVIDMRSVRPLDVDAVANSVGKTGRLLVADTAHGTGSIAAELISRVVEQAFDALRQAPVRIASPDYPVPTSPFLAQHYYPEPQTIADAVLRMVEAQNNDIDYTRLCNALKIHRPHDVPNRDFTGPF
jgi:pyruvate/2-oxoglutarate/acetoin dehydrogenase E1 component